MVPIKPHVAAGSESGLVMVTQTANGSKYNAVRRIGNLDMPTATSKELMLILKLGVNVTLQTSDILSRPNEVCPSE